MNLHELSDGDLSNFIIEAIAQNTEKNKIEFKDARGGLPDSTWKTISSFSNTPGGGVIVFGISEDRTAGTTTVVGGLDLALLQEKITSLCNDTMVNAGRSDHRILKVEEKSLLAVVVRSIPDEAKPCYHRRYGMPTGAYIREGNTDRMITDEEMRQFIRNSRPFKYDKTVDESLNVENLDLSKVKSFLEDSAHKVGRPHTGEPTTENLVNMGIAERKNSDVHPTVAGLLIFSAQNPQDYNTYSRLSIRCIHYAGSDVTSDILDKQDIIGTLDQQIDATYSFILRNIPTSAYIEGTKRIEDYVYPKEAIREIVANAVIHRDYTITQTYTQVRVFADRIDVTNPGNLPPGVTVENIKDAQFSRNEVIASILSDMEYLEEYGRGIDIVISSMQKRGLLNPVFRNLVNTFSVTLLGERFKTLNDRQAMIWQCILENNSINASALQKVFKEISRPTLNNDLAKLVDIGLIRQIGQSRNTRYEINY
ncbi:MAG TPA: ATP-binding protein [Candidatus Saccharimonadales bacterium]|nr:ATP-binding protein [Candidatus Saccharimonadales bacterium]